jgi:hypothetical protein
MADFSGFGPSVAKGNLELLPLALFLMTKGATLPLTLSALAMLITRNATLLLVAILASIPAVFAALFVYDLSRSLAFAFPIFFIALEYLASHVDKQTIRRCLVASAVFNVAMPTYYIMEGKAYALVPIIRLLVPLH